MMEEQQSLPGLDVPASSQSDHTHARERQIFEHMLSDMPFADVYLTLLGEGWYWRDAVYIAWKSLPKQLRLPGTIEELCNLMGISRAAMYQRRQKNTEIDKRANKGLLWGMAESVDEVMEALTDSASNPGYKHHNDRKLFLEMAGMYSPKQTHVLEAGGGDGDMSSMSEEDLLRQAQLGNGAADDE